MEGTDRSDCRCGFQALSNCRHAKLSGACLVPLALTQVSAMTVADVASFLQVSEGTVYRWIRSGKLAAAKLGHRTLRIAPEAVAALIPTRTTDHHGP